MQTLLKNIAFLGLGVMGYPMAGHLVQAGYQVTVYNRTPSKAAQWLKQYAGGVAVVSPAQAAKQADVVLCCVGNDDDVLEVALGPQGAFSTMQKNAIWVDHTTASANLAHRLHAEALARGFSAIDAPVSGGQIGANHGQLSIMCGGDEAVFSRVQPVLSVYAKTVAFMGAAGAGQLTKMVNQVAVAGVLQGLSEALAFGLQAGLDLEKVLAVISQGAAQSWQMQHRGSTMVAQQFDFGFAVNWMRKDLGLVLDEARRNGARLPATAMIDQFYGDIQAAGGGRWDTSSLITRLQK